MCEGLVGVTVLLVAAFVFVNIVWVINRDQFKLIYVGLNTLMHYMCLCDGCGLKTHGVMSMVEVC